jgi:hypothetical protein
MDKIIDNFEQISNLLNFSVPDSFYFVQLIKRKKDNPDMKKGETVVDNFFFYRPEDIINIKHKIVDRCHLFNARAYINLNRLDLRSVAEGCVVELGHLLKKRDYRGVKDMYYSVCGQQNADSTKKWVVDVDMPEEKDALLQCIQECLIYPEKSGYKIIDTIPTVSGYHIITNPFTHDEFNKLIKIRGLSPCDVHKNSPTLLYFNKKD